jgi:acetoin utilization protein AcuB
MRRRHPKRAITRAIRTRRPVHPGREAEELEAQTWPESRIPVRQHMSRGVVTIQSDALARGAAEMMRSRKIRHLPIVDRDGHLVGIVTDRDLRQIVFDPAIRSRLGDAADALGEVRVRDVMTWGVITVRPESDIRDAAWLMRERKVGALPVVDHGKVVGILTEMDILKAFREVLEEGGLAKPYRWALGWR